MSCVEFGSAVGTIPAMRTVPSTVRTRVSPVTQYRIAAGGSLPGEPKLPLPSISG
jgi:hypothetical protein